MNERAEQLLQTCHKTALEVLTWVHHRLKGIGDPLHMATNNRNHASHYSIIEQGNKRVDPLLIDYKEDLLSHTCARERIHFDVVRF